MMPIGTPPNAIAYATSMTSTARMARIGFFLSLSGIAAITLLLQRFAPLVLK
jgi:sodium-dependent dicarboxylate transporter 2/3/5